MNARRRGIIAAGVVATGALALALIAAPAGAKVVKAGPTVPSTVAIAPARPVRSTTTVPPTSPPTTTAAPITDPFTPAPPLTAATAHVSIVDFGFSPASITVTAGTTVVWTNTGQSIHSVTSDTAAFDSSPTCPTGPCIDPGGTFSHTFTTAGTFAYHCRVHANMTASVIVTAAPATTTTTAAGASTTAAPGVSSAGAGTPSSGVASEGGNQLAFTGLATAELWLVLGAVFAVAIGFALRPRRRPFLVPVPHDEPRSRHPNPPSTP
jgi:plastocyanin